MKKKVRLVVFGVLFIFCVVLVGVFLPELGEKDQAAVSVIGGADEPTTIYISFSLNWKDAVIYTLIIIAVDLMILALMKVTKLGVLLILALNLLSGIILFPNLAIISILIDIIIMPVLIIKILYNKTKMKRRLKFTEELNGD